MTPRTSVIVPTFNRANLVRRAVESVLAQTFSDFELIVVDDHSPVPAAGALAGIRDERLRVVRHERNQGGPAARNTGIRESRGEFIFLLDDDDALLPECLACLSRRMDASPASTGVVWGGIRFIDPQGRVMRDCPATRRGNLRQALLRGEKDSNVMGLVRRECFTMAGLFDESLASCQDWDMWLRISEHFEFEVIEGVTALYYCHDGQLSNRLSTLIKGRTRMVEKHRAVFARDPRVLVIHLKRLGKLNALAGRWGQAWCWFREAAGVDGREWGKAAAWLLWEYPRLICQRGDNGAGLF
jgi:glycosyltransferase involved in cell wall biosynthesis